MFFVACELLSKPELKEKPVAVGKSVISTANYVARKYGIRSAMPTFIAKRLCPQLIILEMNYDLYQEKARIFRKILKEYDPQMESMGLDEANLDMTQWAADQGIEKIEKVAEVCEKIRQRIKEETGLTVSCGVAANKMLAKISSEMRKPNGLFVLDNTRQEIVSFLEQVSLRKVPGIGPVTEYILRNLGILTCKDALNYAYKVKIAESQIGFEAIIKKSLGISKNVHDLPEEQKSISAERTFTQIKDINQVKEKLNEVCIALADDIEVHLNFIGNIAQNNKLGKTLSIKIKTFKFETRSKTMQLDKYIGKLAEIQKEAQKILDLMQIKDPIRLIGVRLSELIDQEEFYLRSIARFFEQKTKSKSKQETEKVTKITFNEDNLLALKDQWKVKENTFQSKNQKSNSIKEVPSEQEMDANYVPIEIQQQQQSKKVTPIKEQFGNNSIQELEEIKEESKQSVSKAPSTFICFICQQEIDCKGNNIRMNNHIDQCLKRQQQEQNQEYKLTNFSQKIDKKESKMKKQTKSKKKF